MLLGVNHVPPSFALTFQMCTHTHAQAARLTRNALRQTLSNRHEEG